MIITHQFVESEHQCGQPETTINGNSQPFKWVWLVNYQIRGVAYKSCTCSLTLKSDLVIELNILNGSPIQYTM